MHLHPCIVYRFIRPGVSSPGSIRVLILVGSRQTLFLGQNNTQTRWWWTEAVSLSRLGLLQWKTARRSFRRSFCMQLKMPSIAPELVFALLLVRESTGMRGDEDIATYQTPDNLQRGGQRLRMVLPTTFKSFRHASIICDFYSPHVSNILSFRHRISVCKYGFKAWHERVFTQ